MTIASILPDCILIGHVATGTGLAVAELLEAVSEDGSFFSAKSREAETYREDSEDFLKRRRRMAIVTPKPTPNSESVTGSGAPTTWSPPLSTKAPPSRKSILPCSEGIVSSSVIVRS